MPVSQAEMTNGQILWTIRPTLEDEHHGATSPREPWQGQLRRTPNMEGFPWYLHKLNADGTVRTVDHATAFVTADTVYRTQEEAADAYTRAAIKYLYGEAEEQIKRLRTLSYYLNHQPRQPRPHEPAAAPGPATQQLLSPKDLAAAIYTALAEDHWGDIDPELFDHIATEPEIHWGEEERSLYDVLCQVVGRLGLTPPTTFGSAPSPSTAPDNRRDLAGAADVTAAVGRGGNSEQKFRASRAAASRSAGSGLR